jgi:hypothetical protein
LATAAVTSSAKSAIRPSVPAGKENGRSLTAMMAPQRLPATFTGAPTTDLIPTLSSVIENAIQ